MLSLVFSAHGTSAQRHAAALVCSLAALLAAPQAMAQVKAVRGGENPAHPCGLIYTDHYGPVNYRTQRGGAKLVEDYHFTPRVESLTGGQSGTIGADLEYTLKALPNHHRALLSLTRYAERLKTQHVPQMTWPVECFFDRALRFDPEDTVVRAFYAQYLHKQKRTPEGLTQLARASEIAGDNALSHYNIGLLYLELGAPDKALVQAHRASELGLVRRELSDKLKQAGKWQEPAPAAAASAADPAASAASNAKK